MLLIISPLIIIQYTILHNILHLLRKSFYLNHIESISTHSSAMEPTVNDVPEAYDTLFQLTAPQRNRRKWRLSHCFIWDYFNSRPHKGADKIDKLLKYIQKTFQLTAPRRSRQYWLHSGVLLLPFQLTAPRRSRRILLSLILLHMIFQLTAPRRSRHL